MPVDRNKLDRVQFGMWQISDAFREAEPLQHRPGRWIQAIAAHFFPGKFFPLKDMRSQTSARAKRGAAGSGGAAADDCNIECLHWSFGVIECWCRGVNSLLHYSNNPSLQPLNENWRAT